MQANYKEAVALYGKAIRYTQPSVFEDYQLSDSEQDQLAKARLPNLLNRLALFTFQYLYDKLEFLILDDYSTVERLLELCHMGSICTLNQGFFVKPD